MSSNSIFNGGEVRTEKLADEYKTNKLTYNEAVRGISKQTMSQQTSSDQKLHEHETEREVHSSRSEVDQCSRPRDDGTVEHTWMSHIQNAPHCTYSPH